MDSQGEGIAGRGHSRETPQRGVVACQPTGAKVLYPPLGLNLATSLNVEGCQAVSVRPSTDAEVLAGQVVQVEHIFSKCMVEVGVVVPPDHGCHLYFFCLQTYCFACIHSGSGSTC